MHKHKKALGALVLAGMMVFNVAMTASADMHPEVNDTVTSDNGVAPCFTALWVCGRDLSLANALLGKLSITGTTDSYPGYTAGVKVELQVKNGSSWNTVKTWEDAHGSTAATVDASYYVSRGTYRTYVTHTAYYTSGGVAETFTAYSDEVTY